MTIRPRLRAHISAFLIGATLASIILAGYLWHRSRTPESSGESQVVTVYKSSTCECCKKWVDHLRANGFTVKVEDREDMPQIKKERGVPAQLTSCHTAVAGDYTIEGHVPAADIARLLREKPVVSGLAVPGMPVGSPGMEQGNRWDPFDVLAFSRDGGVGVFATYRI